MFQKLLIVLLISTGVGLATTARGEDERFSLILEQDGPGKAVLMANNDQPFPVTARIDFNNCRSLAHGSSPSVTVVVDASYRGRLLDLKLIDTGKRYGYSMDYSPGDYRVYREQQDVAPAYLFPFQHGRKYKVGQGFFGRFSHSEPGHQHAVDFQLEEGDPVHAVADGIIIRAQDHFRRGGLDPELNSKANVVEIYHPARGTISQYSHLAYGSVRVDVGQRVAGGQRIADSGATGYLSGPHLHFSISAPRANGDVATVPYRFRDTDGSAVEPVEGHYYYANHREQADFEVLYGRDLQPQQLAIVTPLQRRRGELAVVSESVDDSWILYIENPLPQKQEVEIDLSMQGYASSAGSRFTTYVPARSRSFATLLQPLRGAGDLGYNLSYSWRAAR